MGQGKSLGKKWAIRTWNSHIPNIFQRAESGTGTLRCCLARVLPRLTDAIGVVPEKKIIIDHNPAKFAHKPVFQENPYLPHIPADRSRITVLIAAQRRSNRRICGLRTQFSDLSQKSSKFEQRSRKNAKAQNQLKPNRSGDSENGITLGSGPQFP